MYLKQVEDSLEGFRLLQIAGQPASLKEPVLWNGADLEDIFFPHGIPHPVVRGDGVPPVGEIL